ncbi:hypothetical protein KP001_07870 [Geomonas subterranea]|uniref:Uncharacterized protein n=1 Tax=Geomonas subterranea TaxID=2847989 RepID=A0ABX8LSE8_9BACT|nr:hypothetical protein [Geomonas subterranea]QXE92430.1 hypothetical protein KP001_07870 [Geomonas subterranea]QXM09471.1 hypothetical protein KP002_21400 [Geomonas subterranea]
MDNKLTITFPDTQNGKALHAVLKVAIANKDFMDDTKKIKKAVEILTPKSTLTATFKRLQGNALSDYSVNKEKGILGYNDGTKVEKMREYVHDRFKSYMTDPKTSDEATKLFKEAYPAIAEIVAPVTETGQE